MVQAEKLQRTKAVSQQFLFASRGLTNGQILKEADSSYMSDYSISFSTFTRKKSITFQIIYCKGFLLLCILQEKKKNAQF